MNIRPIVAFLCGPAIMSAGYYLSGAAVERGSNLCFTFFFSLMIGFMFLVWAKLFYDA